MINKSILNNEELKDILNTLHDRFNQPVFIESDPICIPHCYSQKEDIEIAAFFSASLAWGQRNQIIKNAHLLMQLMDEAPFDFIQNSGELDLERVSKYYYRTFQYIDLEFFIRTLKHVYSKCGGLEQIFTKAYLETGDLKMGLANLHATFTEIEHKQRSMKHISNVLKGSSAKRLNMFLRWMVRSDKRGVDFGLWKEIPPSALYIPLDVHTGRTSRELGILTRKQNDWKAVEELTFMLKTFDPADPVKYDFALFGAGVEKLI